MKPIIWALIDDRPGNSNQVKALVKKLELDALEIPVAYNELIKLPNFIRLNSLIGIDSSIQNYLNQPWPDIVINAGRRGAPLARHIKKLSGGKTKIIQILWPGKPSSDYDAIILPTHDKYKGKNIINIVGALNYLDQLELEVQKKKWLKKMPPLNKPTVGVIIGGKHKKGDLTVKDMESLFNKIKAFQKENNSSILITTSRRTSKEVNDYIEKVDLPGKYFYRYEAGTDNPYKAFLALSDYFVVTGDSISMCSELISTEKPVYLYCDNEFPDKHKSFHKYLFDHKIAKDYKDLGKSFKTSIIDFDSKLIKKIKAKFVN